MVCSIIDMISLDITVSQSCWVVVQLVSVEERRLVGALADLLVGTDEPDLHGPGASRCRHGEAGGARHGDGVARSIVLWPEVLCGKMLVMMTF